MEIIYIAILFFTFIAGESKNLKFSSYTLIPHSLLIAISISIIAYINNIPSLYLISAVDAVVRAFLIPTLLILLLKNRFEKEMKPSISHPLSIALSIVLLSVSYNFVDTIRMLSFPMVFSSFGCGFTLFIYGLFLLLSKRDTVKMVISFFVIENGIHLLIISMIPHMPKTVELALTFNFVVAVFLFVYVTMRLSEITIMEEIKKLREHGNIFKFEE